MRVLVLGGSGFIGRHATAALAGRGHEVMIGTRRPRAPHPCPAREAHLENLCEARAWDTLLAGTDAVVNAVGILRERGRATYDRVHRRAAGALAEACAAKRIRLVHVSALGLHASARSRFITSKLAGERQVAASGADCCILRPSLLDGDGGFGARWLRWLARWPIHLVPGDALGRIAALDVRDLGEAIARLCEMPAVPPLAEVGGSRAYTMVEYLNALRGAEGLAPAAHAAVPAWLARAASHACDALHFSPFSVGHWELMRRDNLPCPNALPGLLGRAPAAVGASRTRPERRRSLRAAGDRAS
jgi:NADH dehydrogenase